MLRKFSCFYELLSIPKNATKAEVKGAYFRLVKSHHPDQSGQAEYFQKVKEAYETLIEDEKRFDYDLNKGYLNAMDIDAMENNLKVFGSRYVSDEIQSKLEELKLDQPQRPRVEGKGETSPLFMMRVKFFSCLFIGFPVTYHSLLYILETYIYPTQITGKS